MEAPEAKKLQGAYIVFPKTHTFNFTQSKMLVVKDLIQ